MDPASILLVIAAVGVNFGWQPDRDDPRSYEVTAQVEPELLDVLKDGRPIPIESHVPAEITPIRRIRVVVGSGELPRKSLAATSMTTKEPRVVRGQGDTPQSYTAKLPGDDASNGDRYPSGNASAADNSRHFDQRGATIGSEPVRTAQAPWPIDRAQNAVVETGGALRDGVESGIQQANQQIGRAGSQVVDGANNVGRGFNQQLQNLGDTATRQVQSVWPAPPPASGSATGATSGASAALVTGSAPAPPISSSGWTSIRSDFAPPPPLTPSLVNPSLASSPMGKSGSSGAGIAPSAGNSGPIFPPPTDDRSQFRSVLSDPATTLDKNGTAQQPAAQSSASQPNWASGWGSATAAVPATIGRAADTPAARGNDAPVGPDLGVPRMRTEIPRQAANSAASEAERWDGPARAAAASPSSSSSGAVATLPSDVDRYGQPATKTGSQSDLWADWGMESNSNSNSVPANNTPAQPPTNIAAPPNQPVASQAGGNQAVIAFANPANQAGQPLVAKNELPWMPLLAVSLALAGSFGANVYLGWSYADARHRYRRLVEKTTHSFQRATGAAA